MRAPLVLWQARPLAQLPMLAPDEVRQCVADAAGPPAPRALPMLPACVEATVAEAKRVAKPSNRQIGRMNSA